MPKFYVLSGYIRETIDAVSVMDACVKAVRKHEEDEHKMQHLMDFAVSERGLSHQDFDNEADYIVDLAVVLDSAGWKME